jgi:hypothetical protein
MLPAMIGQHWRRNCDLSADAFSSNHLGIAAGSADFNEVTLMVHAAQEFPRQDIPRSVFKKIVCADAAPL